MASSRIAPAAHVAIAVVVAVAIVEMATSATATARATLIKTALPLTLHSCRMMPRLPLMARRLQKANTVPTRIQTQAHSATQAALWIVPAGATAINVIVVSSRIRFASGSAQRRNTRRVSILKGFQSLTSLALTNRRFRVSTMLVNVMASACTKCSRSRALARGAAWKR